MTGKMQILEKDGKPAFAVVPWDEYEALVAAAEDAADRHALDAVDAAGGEERPMDMVMRMVDGDNPVLVWREYRGLSRRRLADAAGISQSYLSLIETNKKPGSVAVLGRIAAALGVSIDDIVVPAEAEAEDKPIRRTKRSPRAKSA